MPLECKHSYRFGDFTVDGGQRVLLRSGAPLPLTPKVFETLLILVENSGRIVEKEELMKRIWPDSFVEEANLTSNVLQLRKSLGDDARHPRFVATVPRRGYRFIAHVEAVNDNGVAETQAAGPVKPVVRRRKIGGFPVAIVATLLVGLAALIVWKMANTSGRHLNELVAALPLNLEKLTASGQSNHVAISADGKYLVYTHGFPNKQSIWLRQLATNTNIQIVPATDPVHGLAFAHSGEFLYFVKGNPNALYRVSLLGGVPTRIVDQLEGRFSISSDDRRIAFVRLSTNSHGEQEYALVIANSDGSAERLLLTRQYPDKLDMPVWSPDGESIICAYGNSAGGTQSVSLAEIRISDGMTRELSNQRFYNIAQIAWLPRGRGLLMAAGKNPEGYRQLWRVSYPTMEFSQITAGFGSYSDVSITTNGDKVVTSQTTQTFDVWVGESREARNLKKITTATDKFCWTGDDRVVYQSMASGSPDLWMMQPDGSGQKQLTVNATANAAPTVTRDNRYIVFISNRSGAFQVWRMNIDGANPVQLTSGVGKNFPSLSPDGKWVVYNSTDDWTLWKVSIDGGKPTHISEQSAFFPSVSPDGKKIACFGKGESKGALLIFSFEGGQPLNRIDPAGQNFSGTRVQWTPDGQALVYATERDGITTLVKQPLSGGRTEEVVKFEDELSDFGYSLDGQMLAVARGGWQHDVVMIKDLNLQ